MSEPTLQAQIDAAEKYEALMVPALFREWASKVADAARILEEAEPVLRPYTTTDGAVAFASSAHLSTGMKRQR
jgi:hypothetical protein